MIYKQINMPGRFFLRRFAGLPVALCLLLQLFAAFNCIAAGKGLPSAREMGVVLAVQYLQESGRIDEALQLAGSILKKSTGNIYLAVLSAEMLLHKAETAKSPALQQQAFLLLRQAFQLDNDSARVLAAFGRYWLLAGNRAAALTCFFRSALLRPDRIVLLQTVDLAEQLKQQETAVWAMRAFTAADFYHPEVYYRLGMHYLLQGEFSIAADLLQRASAGRRDDAAARARVARFVLYREMLDWERADKVVRQMFAMEPADRGIWQRRAVLDFAMERQSTPQVLQSAGAPEEGSTALRRAVLFFQAGQYTAAKMLFKTLAGSEDDNYLGLYGWMKFAPAEEKPALFLKLAALAYKNNRRTLASGWLAKYREAVSDKKALEFYTLSAAVLLEQKTAGGGTPVFSGVELLLREGSRLYPASAALMFYRGELCRLSGLPESSLRWYAAALQKESSMLFQLLAAVRELVLAGKYGYAEKLTGIVLKSYPAHPMALSVHSWLLYKSGARDKAFRCLRTAVTAGVVDGDLFHLLGDMYLKAGNKAAAERYLGKALRISPLQPHYLASMGRLHMERREWQQAEQYFSKALIQPGMSGENLGDLLEALGDLKADQGRPGVAAGYYRHALLWSRNRDSLEKKIRRTGSFLQ